MAKIGSDGCNVQERKKCFNVKHHPSISRKIHKSIDLHHVNNTNNHNWIVWLNHSCLVELLDLWLLSKRKKEKQMENWYQKQLSRAKISFDLLPVILPCISMIHFESRAISRELKGRTRTATLTDDIFKLFWYLT